MTTLTVEAVQRDFDEWRNTRAKVGKIPEQLWTKAIQLLEYYPMGIVKKALHLSGGQLANRRKQYKNTQPKAAANLPAVKFVEIKTPDFGHSYNNCTNQTDNLFGRLEIRRTDGMVLSIEQLSTATIMQILGNFMHGVQ